MRNNAPMPVKHWSFAGLILTYQCNARCASCYLGCDSEPRGWMSVDQAVTIWQGLVQASPHGCRVHLTGGEAFLDWPRLIEICRAARREGLGPLEKVETNAFWATDEATVRDRVAALAEAGMETLGISCDPYHQQFVPIERCRLAARVAEEVLGPDRVQVRWRDWLANGCDTADLPPDRRAEVFARYLASARDRFNGRAGDLLAPLVLLHPPADFADSPCRTSLLRGRHVHVGPDGLVMPGTCAGIVLGDCRAASPGEVWRQLAAEWHARPLLAALARGGPCELLAEAVGCGYQPQRAYAGKCHLCHQVRRHLARSGRHGDELGPRWMYDG